jgi:hypothetical protein
LIYACRIHKHNVPQAPVIGALFLCFRFQDEMEGIFANLARHGALLAILDRHQRVIASSDAQLLPIESVVETVFDERARIVKFGRQDYLAKTAKTKGCQGYSGSGWMGHIMVPASAAFHMEAGKLEFDTKLLKSSRLFSQDLHNISRTASLVNDDLILSVINGQVDSARRNAVEFLPILEAVRSIGHGTREVFDTSINTLYRTVTSSLLSDVQFQAGLAADIMDRNLYERANDVRWWALTSRFREIMAGDRIDEAARADLSGILKYINGLYTVYTNLFIYDTHGMIVAVSNPGEAQLIGSHVGDEERVRATLLLRDSQQYRVSPFAATALYAGRHTYVYHAPVAAPADDRRMVGGIGIVFDSEPQFLAMLNDALPRNGDGSVPEGCFGVLVERGSRIVSSTVAQLPPGSTMEIDRRFFDLRNGEHLSAIIEFDGRPYAVGAAMSKGYREYKTTNDYENDILALIFVAI